MKYRITHTSRFDYSQKVSLCHSEARLLPRHVPFQRCISAHLQIIPEPADYHERLDFFGNRVVYFAIQHPHSQLEVTAISEVEVKPVLTNLSLTQSQSQSQSQSETLSAATQTSNWESQLQQIQHSIDSSTATEHPPVTLYALDSEMAAASEELRTYAAPSFLSNTNLENIALDLTQRIYHDFSYDPSFTTIATPLSTVLLHKRGVCQDFAHLAIACLRAFRVPARYVSGYIETQPPPGTIKLAGSDASHAWFSVYVPDKGWLDFDPTNNCRTGEQHITLAWGRDYNDVTPLKGLAVGGSNHQVTVGVDVSRMT